MNSLIDKCKEKNLLFTQQITNVITKQCFAGDQGRQFPLLKLIYTRCLLDWLNMRKILTIRQLASLFESLSSYSSTRISIIFIICTKPRQEDGSLI